MKKLSLLPVAMLLLGLVTLQSCKKEIRQTFDMNGGTLYFHTNAHPQDGNELLLVDTTFVSDFKSVLSANGIDLDKVESVKLKLAKLSIVDPSLSSGVNFNPFDYANAHIKAGSKAQEQLAFISVIPHDGLTEITLDPQAQDLKDFLKEDNLNIVLKAYNSTDVPDTDYRLDLKYEVEYLAKK